MKRIIVCLLIALFSAYTARPAFAQSENPPAGPIGKVRGTIVNQNTGQIVAQSLEVMLHILDKDFAEKDMKHAQSEPDGSFVFSDVSFDDNSQFAVMATYDGVAYFSDVTASDTTALENDITVPVYESTSDLSNVQIDQMHVLFDFAEDGLETKEVYVFSNTGDHTVKNVYELGTDPSSGTPQFATLEFPLPEDADYIFFKPEDKDRFVKLDSAFADVYPILPQTDASQLMVSYLVPYSGSRTYTYTAPLNIDRINFLVPNETDITLKGSGLTGPEPMKLQNGTSYVVYSYSGLTAGQTIKISLSGKGIADTSASKNLNTPIAVGATFLGFLVIGAAIWWWRRPDDKDDETDMPRYDELDFDQTLREIVRLDQAFEQGEVEEAKYTKTREVLRQRAIAFMQEKGPER